MDKFCGGANYRSEDILKQEAVKAYEAKMATDQCCATREQTVAEYLDDRIFQAVRVADALRDLKASLPGSFLGSGASRITALTLRR